MVADEPDSIADEKRTRRPDDEADDADDADEDHPDPEEEVDLFVVEILENETARLKVFDSGMGIGTENNL